MAETVATNVGAASKTAFGTVKIGNGLNVNPSTGMVEVPVDGSTIGFNSTGQLTALGGGFTPFTIADVEKTGVGSKIGRWTLYNPAYNQGLRRTVAGFVGEDWIYLIGTTLAKESSNITASELFNVTYDTDKTPYINGIELSSTTALTCVPITRTQSRSNSTTGLVKAKYSGINAGVILTSSGSMANFEPESDIIFYCLLNILITVK